MNIFLKFLNTHSVCIHVRRLYGVCIFMNEDFKKEDVIVELKTLIDTAEDFKSEIDAYCEFMKGVFLNTSGIN